jgi:hypothetical protein
MSRRWLVRRRQTRFYNLRTLRTLALEARVESRKMNERRVKRRRHDVYLELAERCSLPIVAQRSLLRHVKSNLNLFSMPLKTGDNIFNSQESMDPSGILQGAQQTKTGYLFDFVSRYNSSSRQCQSHSQCPSQQQSGDHDQVDKDKRQVPETPDTNDIIEQTLVSPPNISCENSQIPSDHNIENHLQDHIMKTMQMKTTEGNSPWGFDEHSSQGSWSASSPQVDPQSSIRLELNIGNRHLRTDEERGIARAEAAKSDRNLSLGKDMYRDTWGTVRRIDNQRICSTTHKQRYKQSVRNRTPKSGKGARDRQRERDRHKVPHKQNNQDRDQYRERSRKHSTRREERDHRKKKEIVAELQSPRFSERMRTTVQRGTELGSFDDINDAMATEYRLPGRNSNRRRASNAHPLSYCTATTLDNDKIESEFGTEAWTEIPLETVQPPLQPQFRNRPHSSSSTVAETKAKTIVSHLGGDIWDWGGAHVPHRTYRLPNKQGKGTPASPVATVAYGYNISEEVCYDNNAFQQMRANANSKLCHQNHNSRNQSKQQNISSCPLPPQKPPRSVLRPYAGPIQPHSNCSPMSQSQVKHRTNPTSTYFNEDDGWSPLYDQPRMAYQGGEAFWF